MSAYRNYVKSRRRQHDGAVERGVPRWRRNSPLLLVSLAALLCSAPAGAQSSTDWLLPKEKPLRVHVVRGLWHRHYRIEDALARLGGALLSDSYHSSNAPWYRSTWMEKRNGNLSHFPDSWLQMMENHVIVICNINGLAFRGKRLADLETYVKNGGSVLFLGGRYAMGLEYYDTPFAKVAPVHLKKEIDLKCVKDGLVLSPGTDTIRAGLDRLPWEQEPRNFWHHEFEPKEGAKVVLKAGDRPLLVCGEYGRGRVAVFAGSVMGDPPEGALPFWEWEGWPQLLAGTIRWLAEARSNTDTSFSDEDRKRLAQYASSLDAKNAKPASTLIERLAPQCISKEEAKTLISAAADIEGDLSPGAASSLAQYVLPFADEALGEWAVALACSGRPHKALLGLRLIGKCRAPEALDLLSGCLKEGQLPEKELDTDADGGDGLTAGLGVLTDPEMGTRNLSLDVRLAAVMGLGDLANPKAVPVLLKAAKDHSQDKALSQEALLSRLRCGDASASDEAVSMLLSNQYEISAARFYVDVVTGKQTPGQKAVPGNLRRQQQLYTRLSTVPARVLPALAKRIAREEDWRVAAVAFAAFARKQLPPEAKSLLTQSRVSAVAALGR